ncbi:MAG: hypothetical protein AAFV19_04870 [Pseudomonadota bacterium]
MSDQEYEDFRRTLSLAQAALRAAGEREEANRKAEAARTQEDDSLQHYRFK